jgi:hypothetical protein
MGLCGIGFFCCVMYTECQTCLTQPLFHHFACMATTCRIDGIPCSALFDPSSAHSLGPQSVSVAWPLLTTVCWPGGKFSCLQTYQVDCGQIVHLRLDWFSAFREHHPLNGLHPPSTFSFEFEQHSDCVCFIDSMVYISDISDGIKNLLLYLK